MSLLAICWLLIGTAPVVHAQQGAIRLATATATDQSTVPATPLASADTDAHTHHKHSHDSDDSDDDKDGNDRVNVIGNAMLAAGEHADNVVSVLGSSTSAGEVSQSVVSVLGNTHVTGPVGENAVAVLGSVYVDSVIGGDVVAVLGNVELGPHAEVGGNLVAVGGAVKRDPASQVHGTIQSVGLGEHGAHFEALQPWFQQCLRYGRPLAFASGLGWAWALALVALAFYLLLALLCPATIDRCVRTLESHPGASLLTMLLSLVATPIVVVVLCISVVGIIAIPFLLLALLLMQSFGKLVMLAWIGRRILKSATPDTATHTAAAVLIGGMIVLILYVVPGLGFVVYKLLGLIGLGIVIYTLLLAMQGRRVGRDAAPSTPAIAAQDTVAPASAASVAKSRRLNPAQAVVLPRAGFWIRMFALLIDIVLVAVVLSFMRGSDNLFLLALASYGAIMWKLRGSTVGGIICNLEVVRHDGREMDWSTAIVRALSSFLSLIALGLGFIWIAIDTDNRAWHDKIAGTVVVRVP